MTIETTEPKIASLGQSLDAARKGGKIIDLDPGKYKPETLDAVLKKKFEDATANERSALSLEGIMQEAVQLARESYHSPLDIEAALRAHAPADALPTDYEEAQAADSAQAELAPFIALRDLRNNMAQLLGQGQSERLQADRLNEAFNVWCEATAKRRHALEVLGSGVAGVYTEAELAQALRSSVQAGKVAREHQENFVERHIQTQADVDVETDRHGRRMIDAIQNAVTLDKADQQRDEIANDYFGITRYLKEQSANESRLLMARELEQDKVDKLEALSAKIAKEIRELQYFRPHIVADLPPHLEHLGNRTSPVETPVSKNGRNQQLISAKEGSLADNNNKLSILRAALQNIDAELDEIRDHTKKEKAEEERLRKIILEDLAIPILLATTPEIQAALEEMRSNKPTRFEFSKDYAQAELWFNDTFAPRVVRQLKMSDPARYANFATSDTGEYKPIHIDELREFISSINIIVSNRKSTFSTRVFEESAGSGTFIMKKTHYNNSAGARENVEMMNSSSSIASDSATKRRELVEDSSELRSSIANAIYELDTYVRDARDAAADADLTLERIGDSIRQALKDADRLADTQEAHSRAQALTAAELAKISDAEAALDQLKDAKKAAIVRRAAGLGDMQPGDLAIGAGQNNEVLLRTTVANSEALANGHATLAEDLLNRAWKEHDSLRAQMKTTAELVAKMYETRTSLLEALEAGGTCGQDVIETAYQMVKDMINEHEDQSVPRGTREEDVHNKFLAGDGKRLTAPKQEKQAPRDIKQVLREKGAAALLGWFKVQ